MKTFATEKSWLLELFARLLKSYVQKPLTSPQLDALHANVWDSLIKMYTKCPECVRAFKDKEGKPLRLAFERAFEQTRLLRPNGNIEFDKVFPIPKEREMKNLRYKGALYKLAGSPAEGAAKAIQIGMSKAKGYDPKKSTFSVYVPKPLGDQDSIMISFASVPEGTEGVDYHNAKHMFNVHIVGTWSAGGAAPAEVKVEMFRNRKCPPLRRKTGSLDVIIAYVISYFSKNIRALQE